MMFQKTKTSKKTKLALLVHEGGTQTNLKAIREAIDNARINAEISAVISDSQDATPILERVSPDYICLAGWKKIIPDEITEKYANKILNIHPGLIPDIVDGKVLNPDNTKALWNKGMYGNKAIKILIIGAGGGREHALGWKIAQSGRAGELFFARGNAGTAQIGTNLDIKETDTSALSNFAKEEKIDITLVASDDALAAGVVDEFRQAGLKIWGPTKIASKLEWSKAFAKDFMQRHDLPTAKFRVFNNFEKANEYLKEQPLPIVVKADGLALGKGVVICHSVEEAYGALENIMVKKIFADSGNTVVIEEFLVGPEISIHALSDGKNYDIFPPSQDHKRIGENDMGPNTAGMGTIAPLPFVDEEIMKKIDKDIIAPTLEAMRKEGTPFEGILYPSLMLTKDGPKIIEFNARFGDPEAQTYMRLLDTDLLDIIEACVDKKLNKTKIKWKNSFACNIALASGGYPGNYIKGKIISGIEEVKLQKDIIIFHANTKVEGEKLVTSGGRVLGISSVGDTLVEALAKAYKAIEKISFEVMQYRKDIGKSALDLEKTNYPN